MTVESASRPGYSVPTVTEVKNGVGSYPLARDYIDFNRYWLCHPDSAFGYGH